MNTAEIVRALAWLDGKEDAQGRALTWSLIEEITQERDRLRLERDDARALAEEMIELASISSRVD